MATLVQSASNTATTASSLTVTLNPTRAGNCLVACVLAYRNSNPGYTVSGIELGGGADNWVQGDGAAENSTASADCEIWTDQDCAGGQTGVAISLTGTATATLAWVMEWSGIFSSGAVDAKNAGNGQSGSWSSGSSGTLAQAGEVVIGAAGGGEGGTGLTMTGPGSPWTELAQLTAGETAILGAGYQVVTATTAQTYSGTLSFSFSSWASVIVTLKTAATAPPGQLLIPPGFTSPMNFQRRSFPVLPFTVSGSDAGGGADTATAGPVPGTGQVLIPPGFTSPMAFRHHSPIIPASLPTFESSDTGTGTDTGTVEIAAADTGTGVDAGQVSQEADTGTGTETGATVTATVSAADTGTGADTAAIGGVKAGDTGSGAEAGSVTIRPLLLVRWSAPDKLDKKGGTMQ